MSTFSWLHVRRRTKAAAFDFSFSLTLSKAKLGWKYVPGLEQLSAKAHK